MSILQQGVVLMPRKENQRIALTRRLLQDGLLRLLATEKLEDISVTALCKEAGINRATFYNHYASPNALLDEMENQLVSELYELSRNSADLEDATNRLEQICIKLREKADLFRILVHYHFDKDLEDTVIRIAQFYANNRLDLYNTKMDADTSHLVSAYLYTGCYAMIQEWLVRDIPKSPREVAELAASIVSKEYL
jgi:AcrR family transcriptional regulator